MPDESVPKDPLPRDEMPDEEVPDREATAGSSARGRQGVGDMVRSMAVVLLLVGGLVFFTVRTSGTTDPVIEVDYSAGLAAARLDAPYDLLAPIGLEGYRATSVRYDDEAGATVWHLGFVTPAEAYIGLDQTDGPREEFVTDLTEGAGATGQMVTIGGAQWERYDGGTRGPEDQVRGLVRMDGTVTVLVSGTADWAAIEEFTAALDAG